MRRLTSCHDRAWLDPVRRAIDIAAEPVRVFFRDDDAGWADDRLTQLLDRFARRNIPLDLAVIPQATTAQLASELLERRAASPIGLHQHGFAHTNHEAVGRKCEFGPSRGRNEQSDDIAAGQRYLRGLFGGALDPIFTPPWNRCTDDTGAAIVAAGLSALSRDHTAASLARDDLVELPVSVDWCRRADPTADVSAVIADALAAAITEKPGQRPIGVMLHHAVTPGDELDLIESLLVMLAEHPSVTCVAMAELVDAST